MLDIIKKTIIKFPKNTNFYSTGAKQVLSEVINTNIKKEFKMKLSDQAMGAIMMALQKSLLEQSDIVPVLKSFQFQISNSEELTVKNPPSFKIGGIGDKDNKTTGSD